MPFLLGAAAGLGLFLLGIAVAPHCPPLARQLAAFDDAWREDGGEPPGGPGGLPERLGRWLAARCAERGWQFGPVRADLALAGSAFETYLARKVLLGLGGLALGPALVLAGGLAGFPVPAGVPVWLGAALGAVFFLLPDAEVKKRAAARRRDFRHAVGAFLDLVAMNLGGGRGVPEALLAASAVGGGWAFWRIRDALATARITGQTPWRALADLGEEVRVAELRDLAAALSLVAEDGAQVRQSLVARAATLRRRELADLAGQAGERSQSMLVAQMLLCAGFLVFLVFPVVGLLLGG